MDNNTTVRFVFIVVRDGAGRKRISCDFRDAAALLATLYRCREIMRWKNDTDELYLYSSKKTGRGDAAGHREARADIGCAAISVSAAYTHTRIEGTALLCRNAFTHDENFQMKALALNKCMTYHRKQLSLQARAQGLSDWRREGRTHSRPGCDSTYLIQYSTYSRI